MKCDRRRVAVHDGYVMQLRPTAVHLLSSLPSQPIVHVAIAGGWLVAGQEPLRGS